MEERREGGGNGQREERMQRSATTREEDVSWPMMEGMKPPRVDPLGMASPGEKKEEEEEGTQSAALPTG